MQTLGIETGPFKETDRGESVPVVLHVDQTLPENTRAASWQFQSCTERVHQAPCSKRSSLEQGFPSKRSDTTEQLSLLPYKIMNANDA